ncbi:MAG: Gfo/Idh/MocA family oxidoreductase [Clostridia bacterium]|nr:Gfo/Idh/MocA family oxidoreductase [Oscillospiraceae bacterium]MBR6747747.1 Gfo/Idh/MocA family oxidoreductase [Clostridia bacterium]
MKLKYAFAGASGRGLGMFCKPMLKDFQDACEIVGVYDINPGRAQQFVKSCEGNFPAYDDFETMINETKPDRVIVTTVDAFHSDYIIKSLEMGCDVITEKPMTIDATRCRAILDAEKRTGHKVTVTFNYRYAPFMTKIREIIANDEIGEVYSVHFEWLLTRNMEYGAHGKSYFHRWNARMKNSGGLLVHKSTHHFDLINWFIDQRPSKVSAFAQLRLYGPKNYPFDDPEGERPIRCSTCKHADECEFCHKFSESELEMFVPYEKYDGYMKDNCIYASDIDIYDTMAVTVQYDKGAVLTYSLNATTPYEGWRCVINGSKGRLEATNYETGVLSKVPQNHIKVFDLKDNVTDYAITKATGGHGGGDTRLRKMLFLENQPDPMHHAAGSADGAYSIIVGAAANISIAEGRVVDVEELLGNK